MKILLDLIGSLNHKVTKNIVIVYLKLRDLDANSLLGKELEPTFTRFAFSSIAVKFTTLACPFY